jgi:hypothetical protein
MLDDVAKLVPERGPAQGRIYRDLDGGLVQVVKVSKNLCTWVPLSNSERTRQVTHRDNFIRRFIPLQAPKNKIPA